MSERTPPSRQVLAETEGRAVRFISTVATHRGIQRAMGTVGYGREDHAEGVALLNNVMAMVTLPTRQEIHNDARQALADLDRQDEGVFRRVQAALEWDFPAQSAYLLDGIGPGTGPAAILGIATLSARLEHLRTGHGRPDDARDADAAALARLDARGLGPDVFAALDALVARAQRLEEFDDAQEKEQERALSEVKRAHQFALYKWYRSWAETARAVIRRRQWLIQLGLAQARSGAARDPEADEDSPEA